ncbi:peroxisome biogenesis protein 3-2 [Carica papaya]|uniref:peroxisome biogenesis protein 3-2 n=1 Tax=Carica papaya TaxID=3649 RepID=UPI000B8CD126|nr:peroxisome biogenesis protein 3-2 [Carica papaya]XP_021909523.1 peroxisome biogenesis protein 3-2 [Carica papaya]
MYFLREFWRRHRRKIFVTTGVLGSGYFLYKLYDAHRRSLADLERQLANERENDEIIKAQMQAHFQNIQRIADTTTLPHAMNFLNSRIAEELDVGPLTQRLNREKATLMPSEKLELWERLKTLSFTRMVMSVWAVTMLSLYIRVQVNILGRHLYIDTARGLGSSDLFDDADLIDTDNEKKFLSGADFLANYGMPALISDLQAAVTEVLKGKQLKDYFNTTVLHETVMQILDMFMSTGNPHHWIDYLMPEDTRLHKQVTVSDNNSAVSSPVTKFDQLMAETREVLSSADFASVSEMSLRAVVGALMEHMETQSEGSLKSGIPLARLLSQVARTSSYLVNEAGKNQFIEIINRVPEVELFFTLLYANMPTSLA